MIIVTREMVYIYSHSIQNTVSLHEVRNISVNHISLHICYRVAYCVCKCETSTSAHPFCFNQTLWVCLQLSRSSTFGWRLWSTRWSKT